MASASAAASEVLRHLRVAQARAGIPLCINDEVLLLQHMKALYMVDHPPPLIAEHAAKLLKAFARHCGEWHISSPPARLDISQVSRAALKVFHEGPKAVDSSQDDHAAVPAFRREGTSVLHLPDDIYGLIYTRINSTADRQSLRSAHPAFYRSRSINSNITTFRLNTLTVATAAFPKHATMSSMTITGCQNLDAVLHWLVTVAASPMDTCWVSSLTLQGCDLNGPCASFLKILFPKMTSPGPGPPTFSLVLDECSVEPAFFECLAGSARLSKLCMHYCFEPDAELFSLLPGGVILRMKHFGEVLPQALLQLHSLTHLSLAFPSGGQELPPRNRPPPITVNSLGRLPNLQSLSLKGPIKGLDEVLSTSLSLKSLSLTNALLRQGERLASPRLRKLLISSSEQPLPHLLAADFPNLQDFRVGAAVI